MVGGFSAAYDQPLEAGYNTLVNYAEDYVDFGIEDYEYCMGEELQDIFSLQSGGFAVSRDDVLAFQECADNYVSAEEKSRNNKFLFMLGALVVLGAGTACLVARALL